ncbi:hypothetical protein A5757_01465 [Mycobacterium sp. 852013-51886_SCH5428379]|nr:hypothetical protein A5757_01465 [Mycobacterium sp. 852013-51886_SCH5428379]
MRWRGECSIIDSGAIAGEIWYVQTMRVAPRPDGTFVGDLTTVVEGTGCESEGDTSVVPVVLSRIGDNASVS